MNFKTMKDEILTLIFTKIKSILDTKSDTSHTHKYAGSSSVGGAATSANKINTNAGSGTQPVYFEDGIPKPTTYTLGKSVPSDALFTDTKYTHPSYTARTSGLYKITVDATGHITAVVAVTKSDITALGIPAQDTTYTLSSFGINASAAELNYCDGVTSNIQTQLNGKLGSTAQAADSAKLGGTAAASYAKLASPTFTGTVTVPTLTVSTTLNIPGGKIWIA